MLDRTEFNRQVRDALSNLFDYAALETHPLGSVFPKPVEHGGSRAEHLRHLLQSAIEKLQPPDRKRSPASVEWRPYLILHARYIECVSLQELQARLSLSERQLRREHSRAMQAVAASLWDRALAGRGDSNATKDEDDSESLEQWGKDFCITRELLDLAEVVRGVAGTLQPRVQSEGAKLLLLLSKGLPQVLTDRVILRLMLLSLLNYALDTRSGGDMSIGTAIQTDHVMLWVQYLVDGSPLPASETGEAALEAVRYWAHRLAVDLQEKHTPGVRAGLTRLIISLPRAEQSIILVVDDQKPAINMFRRYLSRSRLRVVGVQGPEQVLALARQLQPQAITLDVMMPTIDGWEVLQTLQADPETRHIPIIVCSVWDEPELAYSLGAADFLKKPITQKVLLDALGRLKLLDTPVE